MKIKKKDLRRGLAQVPINYPDPDVLPEALPDLGGVIDLDQEMVAVEALCKHLGHNEVALRSAVLSQVPVYIKKVFEPIAAMEAEYEGRAGAPSSGSKKTAAAAAGKRKGAVEGKDGEESEIGSVTAYFAAHPSTPNPYYYHNLTEGLKVYREKVAEAHRREQRRASMMALKEKRAEERRRKALAGRYGADAAVEDDENEHDDDRDGAREEKVAAGVNMHRERYQHWIQSWADLELVLLKLCRGLFFCLWHSDKPLDQLACADTIASFVALPPTSRGQVLLASCLLRVLSREWPSIDHYRMDKYLALVRRVLQQVLLVMRRNCGAVQEADGGRAHLFQHEGLGVPTTTPSSSAAASSASTPNHPSTSRRPSMKARRRSRDEQENSDAEQENSDDENTESKGTSGASSLTSSAALAWGIGDHLLVQHFPGDTHFHRVVREIFFLFQIHLVPNTSSVGMTMHLCDVAFDELEKAFGAGVPPALFAVVAAGIPLFAMSQGNYVEKRVLDQFFPPIAAGVLASRRATQIATYLTKAHKQKAVGKLDHAAIEEQAQAQANADTREIITHLIFCCQAFAVCRGTVRVVRVMFSEAELVLRQTLDPDSYQTLTPSARRRRIEREIEEVNETRHRVREERAGVKEAKRTEKRKELAEKVKQRRKELLAKKVVEEEEDDDEQPAEPVGKKSKKSKKGVAATASDSSASVKKKSKVNVNAAVDKKSILAAIKQEEAEAKAKGKKVKVVRNTKRKKNYELTKKDLYGSDEDES